MKFNGNYDTVTQNMDNFKQEIKNSLVNKYSGTVGLHEAQITLILVTRGSIIITVTIGDDSSLPNSANVTLLLVQMQQDVSDNSLKLSAYYSYVVKNTTLSLLFYLVYYFILNAYFIILFDSTITRHWSLIIRMPPSSHQATSPTLKPVVREMTIVIMKRNRHCFGSMSLSVGCCCSL